MTTTAPSLNPQVLGLAENAHRAILNRILTGTGLTYERWVVFSVTSAAGDVAERDQLVGRAAAALKAEGDEVLKSIDWLASSGLLETVSGNGLRLTESGRVRFSAIRRNIDEIMRRVYGGIPADDLATAGRVLTLVTQRANAELVALSKDSGSS
jgi:hypothetical protein